MTSSNDPSVRGEGGLVVAGPGPIRSADALVAPAVAETLANVDLSAADAAVARLVERYAAALDDLDQDEPVSVLTTVGPKLLAALVELQATPKARARVPERGKTSGALAAVRSARSA